MDFVIFLPLPLDKPVVANRTEEPGFVAYLLRSLRSLELLMIGKLHIGLHIRALYENAS